MCNIPHIKTKLRSIVRHFFADTVLLIEMNAGNISLQYAIA